MNINRLTSVSIILQGIKGVFGGIVGANQQRISQNWRTYVTSGVVVIIALMVAFKFFFPAKWDVWFNTWIFWLSILLVFLSSVAFQIGRSNRGIMFATIAIAMSSWYIYTHPFQVWTFHANGNGKEFKFELKNDRTWKVIPDASCTVDLFGPNVHQRISADENGKVSFKTISGRSDMSGAGEFKVLVIKGGKQTITVESWRERLVN